MNALDKINTCKLLLYSLCGVAYMLYSDLISLSWILEYYAEGTEERRSYFVSMSFRGGYFFAIIFVLMKINLQKITTSRFFKRMWINALICTCSFAICFFILKLLTPQKIHFGHILPLQFFVICVLSTLIGHIFLLYSVQRKTEQELERLKIENLQSRCNALANQINPHFFFNSLNGLTSLIRKNNNEKTLEYVNKLSDVFRYILQSDKKGLVALEEELDFVQSFRYTMEVRFANKLQFDIHVADVQYRLPVLSILPLIDNVVVHNMIDSDHKMTVAIRLNEKKELVVSNPIYPKLMPAETNGTGLKNLKSRFLLLMNREIRIVNDGKMFYVYLPLGLKTEN